MRYNLQPTCKHVKHFWHRDCTEDSD
uniref:Uncharacterized protein n=1 Tax=Anguilla anguilla TaxID=7936 RepID=A0A0E9U1S0_ANGAN